MKPLLKSSPVVFLFAVLVTILAPATGSTTTYNLMAHAQVSWVEDFSLQYVDDVVVDGRLSNSELASVTNFTPFYTIGTLIAGPLEGVPCYDEFESPFTEGPAGYTYWAFYDHPGEVEYPFAATCWWYTQSEVPIPPSTFLLGAGLLGLAGWRRFRKS
jgi:hypothetical protein